MTMPLDIITRFYLKSDRFNGYPFADLTLQLKMTFEEAFTFIRDSVDQNFLTVVFGDIHPNSHIKAFSDAPKEETLEKLDKNKNSLNGNHHVCIYPTKQLLETVVNPDEYIGQPYSYEMALGAGQLEFRYFDLVVLEFYRNDPRYYYWCDDINGRISIHDEYYHRNSMPEKNKILLETFGFAYNEKRYRAVTTFVYYISRLSPEHQQIWKNSELDATEYNPHPDYYRNNILGNFGEGIPICTALLMELKIINEMCDAMGKPALFRRDFDGNDRPRNFSFLFRPTLKEYYDFVGLLDKIMSDNINKKFFENDVPLEEENIRSDGKIEVKPKGTIRLLEEWFNKNFRSNNSEPIQKIFQAFRRVRKERQRPSHAIDDDTFDQKYFSDQRKIIKEAYGAIRTIRLVFANHPCVKISDIDIPKDIFEGTIWTQ